MAYDTNRESSSQDTAVGSCCFTLRELQCVVGISPLSVQKGASSQRGNSVRLAIVTTLGHAEPP
jgi:hypothetical protein